MSNINFQIFNHTENRSEWIKIWSSWKGKEVFAHPDFVALFCDINSTAYCAYLDNGDSKVLYPFILRSLKGADITKEEFFDTTNAYGYGDIYTIGKQSDEVMEKFFQLYDAWATKNGVISEFIRFDLYSKCVGSYNGKSILNNSNVVVDLTLSNEQMWSNFRQKVRKNVNKARNSGVIIHHCEDASSLEAFLEIYYLTMDRRSASKGYYFTRDFFSTIVNKLKGSFIFFNAIIDDQIISTELVLVSDDKIYSFLGGTKEAFFEYRPNDLLKFEIINWAKSVGKTYFVLGGGYTKDDGIFKYKEAFAPEGIVDFYVGNKIFNQQKYDELVRLKENDINFDKESNFFPLYRA